MKSKLTEEHNMLMRIILGDEESGEIGMKKKVDDMHGILVQVKGVSNFFGGIGSALKWLMIIAGVIGAIKGWWIGILAYLFAR